MNTLPLGYLLLATTLVLSLGKEAPRILANGPSVGIVVVGSFGVLIATTSFSALRSLAVHLAGLLRREPPSTELAQAVVAFSQTKSWDDRTVSHPLLAYAQKLWEQGIEPTLVPSLLKHRVQELNRNSEAVIASLRTLAKYPPALGMTGTVLALVSLFSGLSEETRSALGPNLALALTSTFYGLALANLVILPLADRLQANHVRRSQQHLELLHLLLLVQRGEATKLIEDEAYARAA